MNLNYRGIGVDRSAEGLSPGSPTATLAEGPAAIAAPIHPTQLAPQAPIHSYFKREAGPLARAQLHFGQYSQLPRPASRAARRGVRYEEKVLRLLTNRFGNRLVAGPLFTFNNNQRIYPDALFFSKAWDSVCVIEVKHTHRGDGWHQLNRCYLPVVRKALPMFRVCGLEVVATYDPSQRLPQPVAFINEIEDAFETREVFHPLHVLTERELRYDGSVA